MVWTPPVNRIVVNASIMAQLEAARGVHTITEMVLGGVALGLVGGLVCYLAVDLVKLKLKMDDSLDVLAVHGVGGATGTILLVFLA
jgi:ammonia channel protein AmtB